MAGFLAPLLELSAQQVGLAGSMLAPGSVSGVGRSKEALAGDIGSGMDELSKDRSRSRERIHERDCKCPPDKGVPVQRNWSMSAVSREYQAYVTGVYVNGAAPMPSGTEWAFAGCDFDGFRSAVCQLEEAKAKYDQFFDKSTWKPKEFYRMFGAKKMQIQARAHNAIVVANQPAKVRWYFMQPISHAFYKKTFKDIAPLVLVEYKPFESVGN